jgi:hypothetical protein
MMRRLLARLLLPQIRVHVNLRRELFAHRSNHKVSLADARAWLFGIRIPIAWVQWLEPLTARHRCRLTIGSHPS